MLWGGDELCHVGWWRRWLCVGVVVVRWLCGVMLIRGGGVLCGVVVLVLLCGACDGGIVMVCCIVCEDGDGVSGGMCVMLR